MNNSTVNTVVNNKEEGRMAIVIKSREELMNYQPVIMEMKRVSIVQLIATKGKGWFELHEQPMGSTHEDAVVEAFSVVTKTSIIHLDNNDNGSLTYMKMHSKSKTKRHAMSQNGFYANPAENKAIIVQFDRNGAYKNIIDIMSGKTMPVSYEEAMNMVAGCRHYKALDYTPSDIRTEKTLYMDCTHGDCRNVKMNHLTFGAFDKVVASGKTFKRAKITAGFGRAGQQNPGTVNFGEVGNDEFGAIVFDEIVSELSEVAGIIEEGAPTWDGLAWGRSSYLAVALSRYLTTKLDMDITVEPEACIGLQLQERWGMDKDSTDYLKDRVFNRILKNLMDKHSYTVYGNPDNIVKIMDLNTMKNFCGEQGDYDTYKMYHRVLSFNMPHSIRTNKQQMISKIANQSGVKDVLMAKMEVELVKDLQNLFPDKDAKAQIITPEEAMGLKGYSADVLTKIDRSLIYHEPSICGMKCKNMVKKYTNAVDNLELPVDGKHLRLKIDYTELVIGSKVLEACKVRGLINYGQAYSPAFVRWYNIQLAKFKEEHAADYIADYEAINKMDKKNRKAAIAALEDKIEKDANINRWAFSLKYPALGNNEIAKLWMLLPRDIKAAAKAIIAATGCDKDAMADAVEAILNTADGSVIYAAYDLAKYKQAGLDLDADEASIDWDSETVPFFLKLVDMIVKISEPDTTGEAQVTKSRFNRTKENMPKKPTEFVVSVDNGIIVGQDMQMDNENIGIGPATIYALTFAAAKTIEDKAKVLEISLKTKGGKGKYESPLKKVTVVVGNDMQGTPIKETVYFAEIQDSKLVEQAIRNCDLSDADNLTAAHFDINILFRLFQELLIDSAKKGYPVPVNFIIKGIRPMSMRKITSNYEDYVNFLNRVKNKEIGLDDVDNDNRLYLQRPEGGNTEYFMDDMVSLQDSLSELVEEAFSSNMGDVYANAILSDAEMDNLYAAIENNEVAFDINGVIRPIYNAVIAEYMRKIENIREMEEDPELTEELMIQARLEHKEKLEILINTLNMFLADTDMIEAGNCLKAASIMRITKEDGNDVVELDPTSTNSMPYTLGYQYQLAKVIDSVGMTQVGYPLVSGTARHVNVGDKLVFVNGAAITEDNKLVLLSGSIYSGELEIVEEDGRKLAVMNFDANGIIRPEFDPNRVAFRVRSSFDTGRVLNGDVIRYDSEEASEKQRKFKQDAMPYGSYDDMVEILDQAKKIALVPVCEYEYELDGQVYSLPVPNAILATFEDKEGEFEIPVGQYAVESKTAEKFYNGLEGTIKTVIFGRNEDDDKITSIMVELNKTTQSEEESYFDWKEKLSSKSRSKNIIVEEEESKKASAKGSSTPASEKTTEKKSRFKLSTSDEEEVVM